MKISIRINFYINYFQLFLIKKRKKTYKNVSKIKIYDKFYTTQKFMMKIINNPDT